MGVGRGNFRREGGPGQGGRVLWLKFGGDRPCILQCCWRLVTVLGRCFCLGASPSGFGPVQKELYPTFPGHGVQGAVVGAGILQRRMGAKPASGCADMLGCLFQGRGQNGIVKFRRGVHVVFPC